MLKRHKQSKKRFDLLLLQEGEIYFEDFAASLFTNSRQRVEGRLHFCSHSLFFVPDESRYAIMMFAFEKMMTPSREGSKSNNMMVGMPQPYIPPHAHEHAFQPHGRDSLIQLTVTQIVEMKKAGKNHPYVFRKRDPTPVVIGLMYISADDFLAKLDPVVNIWCNAIEDSGFVHRSKINDQLHQMYLLQKQSFTFDTTWLEDFREQKLFEANGSRVIPLVDIQGRFLLTNERVYFQPFNNISSKPVKKWNLADAKRVVKRRHVLRQTGIEIFFSGSSIFFSFQSKEVRDHVHLLIMKQPALSKVQLSDHVNVTEMWRDGLINNFDYLMYLNFMADRTFNDLTQYPIFPWVISDFSSNELNLNDPKTFRDLSNPIGALNPKRLQRFLERYEEMPPPKFLYGTHYSTPGYVLFYLLRTAPEYMLRLQSGRFDDPDRMFYSVSESWNSVLQNDSDVKELIPEFYHGTGEFLVNSDHLNLGTRHDGKKVKGVRLPSWASDEKDFVYKSRLALESDYVSENLHNWIDLIFGYKQRGIEAEKANNVFYHLTYEGAIDIEKVKDPVERNAYEIQIREFGQTPTQLFTSPHPCKRETRTSPPSLSSVTSSNTVSLDTIYSKVQSTRNGSAVQKKERSSIVATKPTDIDEMLTRLDMSADNQSQARKNVDHGEDSYPLFDKHQPTTPQTDLDDVLAHLGLVTGQPLALNEFLDEDIHLDVIHRKSSSDNIPLMQFHAHNGLSSVGDLTQFEKVLSTQIHRDAISSITYSADDEKVCTTSHDATSRIFSLSNEHQLRRISKLGDTVLSAGIMLDKQMDSKTLVMSSWNNRIYMYSVDYGRVLDTLYGHEDAVADLDIHGTNLISGSWDSTVKLWKITNTGISNVPLAILTEHDTEVQCVTFEHKEGHLAASGSKDGDVAIYDVRSGEVVNSFTNHYDAIRDIAFLDAKTVVTCSKDNCVKVCTIDGSVMHTSTSAEAIHCLATEGQMILTGGGDTSGVLNLWSLGSSQDLQPQTMVVDGSAPITCVSLIESGKSILTGSKDGRLVKLSAK